MNFELILMELEMNHASNVPIAPPPQQITSDPSGGYVPTWQELIDKYPELAERERQRSDKPNIRRVHNVIQATNRFISSGIVKPDDRVNLITGRMLRTWMDKLLAEGKKPISVHSYIQFIGSLFGHWIQAYYDEMNWNVPSFPANPAVKRTARFREHSAVKIDKVKQWYASLDPTTPKWMCVTMMLHYAMRNGDVLRLSRENFVPEGDEIYLLYKPHKTQYSSQRIVHWPVNQDHWEKIDKILPETGSLVDVCDCIASNKEYKPNLTREFQEINKDMRAMGFTGSKGAYELRKIATNAVYKKFGAEMAVSLSGDDIKTILHFYADPSSPHTSVDMMNIL